jgi:hypothetical protein
MPTHWYCQKSTCNIIHAAQDSCLKTNGSGLPVFRGYGGGMGEAGGPDRRIHHQHQAIIPSYKFNCCGNITQWGVDLNPNRADSNFTFILQIWRPSPHVDITGCYSLVDDFTSTRLHVNNGVAVVTPSAATELSFQADDVLGFYVESHIGTSDHDNGVVVLRYQNWRSDMILYSESVWYGSIDATARTSQSGSCPYPIGTNGVLNTSTNAAPVISISAVMVTTCLSSSVHYSSALINSITSTTLRDLTRTSVPLISPSTRPNYVTIPESSDGIIDNVLIIGIVTIVLIFVIVSIIILVIVIVVMKRQSGTKQAAANNAGMTLSNQLYGESASRALHLIPAMIMYSYFD